MQNPQKSSGDLQTLSAGGTFFHGRRTIRGLRIQDGADNFVFGSFGEGEEKTLKFSYAKISSRKIRNLLFFDKFDFIAKDVCH